MKIIDYILDAIMPGRREARLAQEQFEKWVSKPVPRSPTPPGPFFTHPNCRCVVIPTAPPSSPPGPPPPSTDDEPVVKATVARIPRSQAIKAASKVGFARLSPEDRAEVSRKGAAATNAKRWGK